MAKAQDLSKNLRTCRPSLLDACYLNPGPTEPFQYVTFLVTHYRSLKTGYCTHGRPRGGVLRPLPQRRPEGRSKAKRRWGGTNEIIGLLGIL